MNLNVLFVLFDRFCVISDEWVIIIGEYVVLYMLFECVGVFGFFYSRIYSLL